MFTRVRISYEPETLWGSSTKLIDEAPRDDRFDPQEVLPTGHAYVIRDQDGERAWDVMTWDLLGGQAAWPMTCIRDLALPQWRRLVEKPENRCIVPLTEFCAWAPDEGDLPDGTPAFKGKEEMWFSVTDQPVFAVAAFWHRTVRGRGFAMVTCDPNELVAPIHPEAMITVLEPDDIETWLRGSYDDVVALQRPYDAGRMTVRGPVFPMRREER